MTLLGLTLQQLALAFGVVGAAVTVLYILKLRRRRVQVPFAKLWERVIQERESTSLFRRLKRLLSLLAQLLLLFLITAALGDPRLSSEVLQGRNIILLLDASASMKATDEAAGTRLAAARLKARELVHSKGGADLVMVVSMGGGQVTPLTAFVGDERALSEAIDTVQARDVRADLPRALKFCADALRGRKNPLLILLSDGAFPEHVRGQRVDLRGVDLRHVKLGRSGDNVGIVAFNARRYPRNKLSFEMFLEVVNYRDKETEADLQILSDGRLIEVQRLRLPAGKKSRYVCDSEAKDRKRAWCRLAASGELLEARLVAPGTTSSGGGRLDVFPADDRALALLPRRRKQRVLLVTRGNLFLEGAVLLDESLDVRRVPPSLYSAALAKQHDAVIFDRNFPAAAPPRNYVVIQPPAKGGPLPVTGALATPIITEQDVAHPVMRWVTLKDVNIGASLRFGSAPGVKVLASSFKQPLLVAREQGALKMVAFGFDITRSDLPMRVAFPLLIINSLDWFSGDSQGLVTSYRTGRSWSVPLTGGGSGARARVDGPDGRHFSVTVEDGRAAFGGQQAGVYTVTRGKGHRTRIAANLADPVESNVKPPAQLMLAGSAVAAPSGFGVSMRRELWIYLLLAAAGLVLLEWLTYNRRVTV